MMNEIETIVVHAGPFHSDDVAVVAMLLIAFPQAKVVRTFKPEEVQGNNILVADVGLGKYDHHQEDCQIRPDGQKRAACGLVFSDYYQQIGFSKRSAEIFERMYIIPIEDQDNGRKDNDGNLIRNPLSEAIKSFNPSWNSSETPDEAFMRAVNFFKQVVENELRRCQASEEAERYLEQAVSQKENGLIVLEQFVPTGSLKGKQDIRYIAFPSQRGGWEVQPNDRKLGLPKSWIEAKPKGCTFVHPNGFIARFGSLDDLKQALCPMKNYAAIMSADDPEDQYSDIEMKAYVKAYNEEEALEKAKSLSENDFTVIGALEASGYYVPHWNTLWVTEV